MVDIAEYILLIPIFIIGIFAAWLASGRMKIALQLLIIFAISSILNIFMFAYVKPDTREEIVILGVISISMMALFALRFNVLVKDPYKKLSANQQKVVKNRDLTNYMDEKEEANVNGSGELNRALYFDQKARNMYSSLISSLVETQTNLVQISQTLIQESRRLDKNGDLLSSDVQSILQHIATLNDSSDVLQQELEEFQSDLSYKFEEIANILQSADRISDQTNLIAVNAAIEAAHSTSSNESFGLVADSIQQLSARSRTSTDKLLIAIRALQEETVGKIAFTLDQLRNYEDSIFQIAEMSNSASKYTIAQKEMIENIHTRITSVRDRINRAKSKYDGYII